MNKKQRIDSSNSTYRRYHGLGQPVVNISARVNQNIIVHQHHHTRNETHIDLTIEDYDEDSSDTEAGSVGGEEVDDSENARFNEEDYLNDEQLAELLHIESNDPKIGAQIDHPTTIQLQEYNGLVPGMAVELVDGDFMRVKKILRLFNGDVYLRGYYFKKLLNLPTPFPQRHRELCWLMKQADGAMQLEKDIAISTVRRISKISLTNQTWHSRVARLPDSYICRLAWQETSEKGETIIRYLSVDEADVEFQVPAHIIREKWREETIPFGSERVSNSTAKSRKARTPLKMQRQYSFGDAFCGAGGVSVGASLAGLRVKYGIDMDEAACQTYRTNFVHSWCYHADFTSWHALHGADEMRVDISHSSPPCQPFSPAHTRSYNVQRDEANSSLIFSAFNMIQKVKPRIHTIEETFGVVSRHRETLERMLQDILELGYSIHSRVVSCEKYGVPQARKRLFIIAAG
jgi:DNA (cytosine-5)-methyltransferase 1